MAELIESENYVWSIFFFAQYDRYYGVRVRVCISAVCVFFSTHGNVVICHRQLLQRKVTGTLFFFVLFCLAVIFVRIVCVRGLYRCVSVSVAMLNFFSLIAVPIEMQRVDFIRFS